MIRNKFALVLLKIYLGRYQSRAGERLTSTSGLLGNSLKKALKLDYLVKYPRNGWIFPFSTLYFAPPPTPCSNIELDICKTSLISQNWKGDFKFYSFKLKIENVFMFFPI